MIRPKHKKLILRKDNILQHYWVANKTDTNIPKKVKVMQNIYNKLSNYNNKDIINKLMKDFDNELNNNSEFIKDLEKFSNFLDYLDFIKNNSKNTKELSLVLYRLSDEDKNNFNLIFNTFKFIGDKNKLKNVPYYKDVYNGFLDYFYGNGMELLFKKFGFKGIRQMAGSRWIDFDGYGNTINGMVLKFLEMIFRNNKKLGEIFEKNNLLPMFNINGKFTNIKFYSDKDNFFPRFLIEKLAYENAFKQALKDNSPFAKLLINIYKNSSTNMLKNLKNYDLIKDIENNKYKYELVKKIANENGYNNIEDFIDTIKELKEQLPYDKLEDLKENYTIIAIRRQHIRNLLKNKSLDTEFYNNDKLSNEALKELDNLKNSIINFGYTSSTLYGLNEFSNYLYPVRLLFTIPKNKVKDFITENTFLNSFDFDLGLDESENSLQARIGRLDENEVIIKNHWKVNKVILNKPNKLKGDVLGSFFKHQVTLHLEYIPDDELKKNIKKMK